MASFESAAKVKSNCEPGSLLEAAEGELRTALQAMESGQSEHYAREARRAVEFMLGGSGPTTRVVFMFRAGDALPFEAVLIYTEHTSAAVAVPEGAVERLYNALRAYGN